MPRDVSWSQEIALPVGQSKLARDIEKVEILGVHPGKPAPDFTATTLDGKPFKLSALRGKVVLLDFWATLCSCGAAKSPSVKEAHEKYAEDGLVAVGISLDRREKAARDYISEKQLTWVHIWVEKADKGPIADLYGVSSIPATFLIAPDGKVVGKDLRGDKLLEAVRTEITKLSKAKPET